MDIEQLQQIVDPLIERESRHGLGSLDEREQVAYLVWCFAGQIDNGGFAQFLFDSTGAYARETARALREVAAPLSASLLERAIQLFPGAAVLAELEERNTAVQAFPTEADAEFEALDEEFFQKESGLSYERLARYWNGQAAA